MRKLALAVLFAATAFGQDLTRTFQLKNSSGAGLQEIATTLRTVFQIQQLSIDNNVATLTVSGNADEIALAEWLVPKLDIAPGSNPSPQKYFYAGNNNDVTEIFELKNATLVTNLQEMLTTLRTVADIQKIYMSTAPRILIIRTDANHIALAEFMISQLDQPAGSRESQTVQSFQAIGLRDNDVIVYGLAHTATVQGLQQILTTLRTVLDIQFIYQYTAAMLLPMRGNASQIQMVEWLLPKLDATQASTSGNEMQVPGGKDDVLRVFYLTPESDPNSIVRSVRTTLKIAKAYFQTTPPAVVVRGTADQIAMAGSLIAGELNMTT
jgi:hypothetical protein